jgi:hypothetical protein
MQTISFCEQSFETVATTTIRLGRELARLAQEVHAGGNSQSVNFISASLRRVIEREPFDDRDDASLGEVRRIIIADLKTETLGVEPEFVEVGYDCDGPVIAVRETTVYSERGEDLVRLLGLFEKFLTARAATLDRAAAERAIRRLTSGY